MKKERFLKELRKRLIVLNEQEVEDIIKEYQDHIKNKMEEGMSEEEAVKDFGDIDELAREILKAYKINVNYQNSSKLEDGVDKVIKKGATFLEQLADTISQTKKEDLFRILFKFLGLLLLLALFRIPFYILTEIIFSMLDIFPGGLGSFVYVVWKILLKLLYIVVSLFIIYYFIKHEVIENHSNTPPKEEKKEKSESEEKETKEEKVVSPSKKESSSTPSVLLILFKILVIFSAVPFILMMIGLAIALGFLVAFGMQGIYLISLFLIIIGLLAIVGSVVGVILHVAKELK